jgi:ketosteroid isomerase-like protein
MDNDPADVVREYYRRFDLRADDAFDCFAEDVVYVRPTVTLAGASAVREHFAALPRVASVRHVLHRVICSGTTVVVEGRVTGTLRHREIDQPFADIWDLDPTGRVARRASYFDAGGLA